jgi:phosphoglycolate phosphatase-like HAD superfamily hydrolase
VPQTDQAPLAIMFDIDSTLITVDGAGSRSWAQAFRRLYGVDADIEAFTEQGMTDPEVARRTFIGAVGRPATAQDLARLIAAYLERLEEEVERSPGYRIMPGVEALLPSLADAGILLGLVSGNVEMAARIKLGRGRLNRFFAVGGYGSDSADRGVLTRVAIERCAVIHGHTLPLNRVLVVGDTPRDITAAHAAGVTGVGVATGKYSVDALRAAGADYVMATLETALPGVQRGPSPS